MKTARRFVRLGEAGFAAAVIATVVAACGQKGPLILPDDEMEPTETQIGSETTDDEEQDDG